MMPTFTQLYGGGNIVGVPDLKPETGNHYEVGFKKNIGNSTWRFDVFHYKIKGIFSLLFPFCPISTGLMFHSSINSSGVISIPAPCLISL